MRHLVRERRFGRSRDVAEQIELLHLASKISLIRKLRYRVRLVCDGCQKFDGLAAKTAEIRRLLPLTLPLRGSLPLPASGEREGVRGNLCAGSGGLRESDSRGSEY